MDSKSRVMDMLSLKVKTAIVAGGGQWLGKGIALGLAEASADIVIVARCTQTAMETKPLIEKNGVKCTVNPCNVTEPGQVESIIDQVLKEYGKIDVLANNAGIWRVGDAENFPLSDCEEVIRINLTAPFIVSETVGKEMIKQKRGNILMIASMSGRIVNTQQI